MMLSSAVFPTHFHISYYLLYILSQPSFVPCCVVHEAVRHILSGLWCLSSFTFFFIWFIFWNIGIENLLSIWIYCIQSLSFSRNTMLKGAFSCWIRASDSGHTVVIKQYTWLETILREQCSVRTKGLAPKQENIPLTLTPPPTTV